MVSEISALTNARCCTGGITGGLGVENVELHRCVDVTRPKSQPSAAPALDVLKRIHECEGAVSLYLLTGRLFNQWDTTYQPQRRSSHFPTIEGTKRPH